MPLWLILGANKLTEQAVKETGSSILCAGGVQEVCYCHWLLFCIGTIVADKRDLKSLYFKKFCLLFKLLAVTWFFLTEKERRTHSSSSGVDEAKRVSPILKFSFIIEIAALFSVKKLGKKKIPWPHPFHRRQWIASWLSFSLIWFSFVWELNCCIVLYQEICLILS